MNNRNDDNFNNNNLKCNLYLSHLFLKMLNKMSTSY